MTAFHCERFSRAGLGARVLAALALLSPLTAYAEPLTEFPARKPGGWEIKMLHKAPAGLPPTLIQACIDAVTDKQMMEAGLTMSKEMCQSYEMKREGATIVMDAVCAMGPMKTTSHTVIAGDFQSAYTMTITGTVDGMPALAGQPAGPQQTSMSQEAKWTGAACPAGMKPGDMTMPGGITINVNDMLQMKAPAAAAPKE